MPSFGAVSVPTALATRAPEEAAPSSHDLVTQAIALLTAATATGQPIDDVAPLRTPGEALLACVTGRSDAQPDQLGVPAEESRLVVLRTGSCETLGAVQRLALPPRRAVCVERGTEWLLLVPGVPHSDGVDAAGRDVRQMVQHLRRCGLGGWRAGISARLRGAAELGHAYRDATDVLALGTRSTDVVVVDEVWAQLTVQRLSSVAVSALPTRSPLDELRAYDMGHGTCLADSLNAWLDANADIAVAARALTVHPNTLRYRVKRAAELAGLDLNDPAQRLVVQLMRANCKP